ncbi:MAG: anti-sigma factor domain-containing protein [Actinomycetes bacterium]
MNTPAPQDLHSLAAAYVLDALSAEEAAEFETHLAQCEACRLDVLEMNETTAALAASVVDQAPEGLRRRVLELAARTTQDAAVERRAEVVDLADRRQRRSGVNRWLAGIAAAGLVAAGALGVTTYQANQRADDAQVAADQVSALLADPNAVVEHGDVSGGGAGTLVVSPDEGRALFTTADLPQPTPDHTYQLWAIDESGATSVGLLQPDSGRASQLVDVPPGSTTFGMTIEPAGGSVQPTTKPILLLELPA